MDYEAFVESVNLYTTITKVTSPLTPNLLAVIMGLIEETSEFEDKLIEFFNSPYGYEAFSNDLLGEIADTYWYLQALHTEVKQYPVRVGPTLAEVVNRMRNNITTCVFQPFIVRRNQLIMMASKLVKKSIRQDADYVDNFEQKLYELFMEGVVVLISMVVYYYHEMNKIDPQITGYNKDNKYFLTTDMIEQYSINKLTKRKERGVLRGDGDNR